jgi:subtilisin family serine protease
MRKYRLLCCILLILLAPVSLLASPSIRLRYAVFDPLVSQPTVPSDLRSTETPGVETYYLVQYTGPILDAWKANLQSLGAEIQDYIPDYAFIAYMTPEAAQQARLQSNVRWVGLFHPAYRVSSEILAATGTSNVVVRMFHRKSRSGVEAQIKLVGGSVDRAKPGADAELLETSLSGKAIRKLLSHPEVSWIEPRAERKLCNTIARGITTVTSAWSTFGLYGTGEIIGVCDTGLDTGSVSTMSSDFAGRVFKTYCMGRTGAWDDPDGHGTHVIGSLLGSGALSGSNPATHSYPSTAYTGMAPEAQVCLQSMLTSSGKLGGFPSDLKDLFQSPYDDGARVHTNSWDVVYQNVYTTDCRNVDEFIWNHPDMNILFAAGNEGKDADQNGVVEAGSIMPPATAKNCISVGATESSRMMLGTTTYGYYWPSAFPASPISSDRVSNNSSGMAAFSGRGPCSDGRIKPDICAPGTSIISARSHAPGAGVLSGAYNADYVFSTGTSMSTPFVAGAAALVRQFFRTQKSMMPSAALVKATLINGAKDITPGQYGVGFYREVPPRPNSIEGWGRLDVGYSISQSGMRTMQFIDNAVGLYTNGSVTYTFTVTESTNPVRATLVWSDYPACTAAAAALVNDLDLTVIMPNGVVKPGNNAADHTNNVEGVDIASPSAGVYTVTVTAPNVPYGPQPYALVVSADMFVVPPTTSLTAPANGMQLRGPVDIKGTAYGSNFQYYTLAYGVGPTPTTWTPIGGPHYTQVVSNLLGAWDTTGMPDGLYTIRLIATNSSGSGTAYISCNLVTTSVSQVKGNQTGTVTLTGKVVTAGKPELGGFMYIQEPDRTSGIRINLGTVQTDSDIGSVVTVTGAIGLSGANERVITNPTITTTGSYTGRLAPISLSNRDVGGEALNAYTPGVTGGTGLNNLCLLVRTFGRVTEIGADYFKMDDGSALDDGSGVKGIKVFVGGLTLPTSTSQYAVVTGISSTEMIDSNTIRLIRARRQTDLVYY